MSIFTIEYKQHETDKEDYLNLTKYIRKVKMNLQLSDVVKNPFNGKLEHIPNENLIVVDMTPIYPNPLILTLVSLAPILIFKGFVFSYWLIIPFLFCVGSIPHLAYFQYMMFVKGARKGGFKGSMKLLSNAKTIRRLV